MKRILLAFFILSTFSLHAQQVDPVQKTLITKRTASWCSNCGSWGWDFFEDLVNDNSSKAYFFAAHYSGDLETDVAQDLTNNFGSAGQPQFFFNENNIGASSSNADDKRTEVLDMVTTAFDSEPVVGVGLEVFWDEDNQQILVNTNTKFFQNTIGQYYTAVYLVENNVVNFQQSQGPDAIHKKVLRASFTDNSFGTGFAIGEFAMNDEFPNTFTMTGIENPMVSNLNYEYVAVIWELIGNTYEVVNVNGTTEINELVIDNVEEITTAGVAVFPSIFTNQVTVEFDLTQNVQQANFTVMDITGKAVSLHKINSLASGEQQISIDLSAISANGTYFLLMDLDGRQLTQKLIKQ